MGRGESKTGLPVSSRRGLLVSALWFGCDDGAFCRRNKSVVWPRRTPFRRPRFYHGFLPGMQVANLCLQSWTTPSVRLQVLVSSSVPSARKPHHDATLQPAVDKTLPFRRCRQILLHPDSGACQRLRLGGKCCALGTSAPLPPGVSSWSGRFVM